MTRHTTGALLLGALLTAFACRSSDADVAQAPDGASTSVDTLTFDGGSVTMPGTPEPIHGHLVLRNASADAAEFLVHTSIPMVGFRCEAQHALVVVGTTVGYGAVLFVSLADSGAVAEYPIYKERDDKPRPGTSRVAVQAYPGDQSYVWVGDSGSVTLDLGDDTVSGRVNAWMTEFTRLVASPMSAVFTGVAIRPSTEDECGLLIDEVTVSEQ